MRVVLLIVVLFISLNGFSQNVGQQNSDKLNYTDINGLKQGHWKKTYENGKLKYEAYFIDNKPVGDFKKYDKYGNLIAYVVYDTLTDFSRAKFYYSNKKILAEGNYIGKKKDSVWNYYNDNGIKYLEESYSKGVKNGVFKRYSRDRKLLEEVTWKNGVEEGLWRRYYANGDLKSESYKKNGVLDGESKTWYRDGRKYMEGRFENGLMEGVWFKYKKTGAIDKIYRYKHGYSPEAEEEGEEMVKEMLNNKGKYQGPSGSNDIEWLRRR
jgi:antitoxin component YwqK of YwqJK toxin-antitoxin module